MTIPEICLLMSKTLPNDFAKIAYELTKLDTKTALELIQKYNQDIKMSEKQLNEEIVKQKIKKVRNEL